MFAGDIFQVLNMAGKQSGKFTDRLSGARFCQRAGNVWLHSLLGQTSLSCKVESNYH